MHEAVPIMLCRDLSLVQPVTDPAPGRPEHLKVWGFETAVLLDSASWCTASILQGKASEGTSLCASPKGDGLAEIHLIRFLLQSVVQ